MLLKIKHPTFAKASVGRQERSVLYLHAVIAVDFPTRNKARRVHLVHEQRGDTVGDSNGRNVSTWSADFHQQTAIGWIVRNNNCN